LIGPSSAGLAIFEPDWQAVMAAVLVAQFQGIGASQKATAAFI